jgi:uncharacterized protein YbjT (DUF2867 family)
VRVLVTGATGYVGSRLVPRLLDAGHEVVAAVRSEGSTGKFAWGDAVTEALFDIEDPDLIVSATQDVDAVVYLVHSMGEGDFVQKDRDAAEAMANACEKNSVQRIVYLSGLIPHDDLSDHLRSRLEVETVFLESDVPATVLRAAMVIGAGSTSFELLRRMSERVPFTPIPSWMRRTLQPVAVQDVLSLFVGALEGEPRNRHYDIGGEREISYPDLLRLFARTAGLKRPQVIVPLVPVPVVGALVSWIAGMPRGTVTPLIDSLSHDMVCEERDAERDLLDPSYEFLGLEEALERSLAPADEGTERGGDPQAPAPTDPDWSGGSVFVRRGRIRQVPRSLWARLGLGVRTAQARRQDRSTVSR